MSNTFIRAGLCASALAALCSFGACNSGGTPDIVSDDDSSYQGTASVGDFLLISIDRDLQTIDYENLSNGDSGTTDYSLDSDGSYLLSDDTGNFTRAWEIPGFAMVIEASKTGPDSDTPALISAVQSAPVGKADLPGNEFNYIQFRTTDGGIELGHGEFDSDGNLDLSHYTPRQEKDGNNPFDTSTIPSDDFVDHGTYVTQEDNDGTVYIFGTQSGFWAVDTPNGAVVAMQKAASKEFQSQYAGTYQAFVYQKSGAQMSGDTELGDVELLKGEITISTDGKVTIVDADSDETVTADAELTPIADDADLYDGTNDKLHDACHGLFSFEVPDGGGVQQIFVAFLDDALLMGSFSHQGGATYDYLYGFALRTSDAAPEGVSKLGADALPIANIAPAP